MFWTWLQANEICVLFVVFPYFVLMYIHSRYLFLIKMNDFEAMGNIDDLMQDYINSISPDCHIYVSVKWGKIGSGNGLLPVWRQAITRTNAPLLSIEPVGTN